MLHESGNSCVFVDRYYSQCRPSSSFTIGDDTTSELRPPISFNQQQLYRDPTSSFTCQEKWQQRWRSIWTRPIDVADANDFCFVQDEYYAQCRPKIPACASNYGQCGGRLWQKTPAALSTAAAIRVITASRKTNIIRSVAQYERNGLPCARTYEQCGGSLGPNGPRCCANSGDYCFVQDAYYAQCRPKMFS